MTIVDNDSTLTLQPTVHKAIEVVPLCFVIMYLFPILRVKDTGFFWKYQNVMDERNQNQFNHQT